MNEFVLFCLCLLCMSVVCVCLYCRTGFFQVKIIPIKKYSSKNILVI